MCLEKRPVDTGLFYFLDRVDLPSLRIQRDRPDLDDNRERHDTPAFNRGLLGGRVDEGTWSRAGSKEEVPDVIRPVCGDRSI